MIVGSSMDTKLYSCDRKSNGVILELCHKNIPNIHRRIEIRAGVVHMDINK